MGLSGCWSLQLTPHTTRRKPVMSGEDPKRQLAITVSKAAPSWLLTPGRLPLNVAKASGALSSLCSRCLSMTGHRCRWFPRPGLLLGVSQDPSPGHFQPAASRSLSPERPPSCLSPSHPWPCLGLPLSPDTQMIVLSHSGDKGHCDWKVYRVGQK